MLGVQPAVLDDVPALFSQPLLSSAAEQAAALSEGDTASNRMVTADPGVQEVTAIAVDPLDPNHVAIAYLDYSQLNNGFAGVGVAVSPDGGESWQHSVVPLPEGFDQSAKNPVVRFDDGGHLYVSFSAVRYLGEPPPLNLPARGGTLPRSEHTYGMEANNGVFVVRSDDGGQSWQDPITVAQYHYDGSQRVPYVLAEDLAIDTFVDLPDGSPNPYYGTMYLTYATFYPAGQYPGEPDATGGSNSMIATSADGGAAWQTRMRTLPGSGLSVSVLWDSEWSTGRGVPEGYGYLRGTRLALGPEGNVYVSNRGAGFFSVGYSTDGAASFLMPSFDNSWSEPDDSAPPQNFGFPLGISAVGLDHGLSANDFVVPQTRAIAADPTRPGVYYAAEAVNVVNSNGEDHDRAEIAAAHVDVNFAEAWRSWSVNFPINDDFERQEYFSDIDQPPGADQFAVQIAIGADGTLGMVWFDTRRDPANRQLDVYGTTASLGSRPRVKWDFRFDDGINQDPNFRVTDASFDPQVAAVTDATGREHEFAAGALSLAMADGAMYVAWSDTRSGNMDVQFRRIVLDALGEPLNDRLEPNDAREAATAVGTVLTTLLPQLVLAPGDADWFSVASETGQLIADVLGVQGMAAVEIALFDAAGAHVPADVVTLFDEAGLAIGRSLSAEVLPGQTYFVRIASSTDSELAYDIQLQSLVDLGAFSYRLVEGTLAGGRPQYYRMTLPAAGAIDAALVLGGGFSGSAALELLDPQTLDVLAASDASGSVTMPVRAGQEILLRLAPDDSAHGDFQLALTNLDQNSGAGLDVLHVPAGIHPAQMAIEDFNRDGHPDMVVANALAGTVSVLLANGDGTFGAPRSFAVGATAPHNSIYWTRGLATFFRDVRTGDFNEDGIPDIAASNAESADVSILLGRGDGTFAPQRRFDTGEPPAGMSVGDVNGDGHEDLVVVGWPADGRSVLIVMLGRGDGTFAPAESQPLPDHPLIFTLADVDQNGTLDIVGSGLQGGLVLLEGDGDGKFSVLGHAAGVASGPAGYLVADVDGDGDLDVIEAKLSQLNSVGLFLGDGTGAFADGEFIFTGDGPIATALVDWGSEPDSPDANELGPRDGRPDLVVANSGLGFSSGEARGAAEIVVLPARFSPDGTFLGYGAPRTIARAEEPLDLKVADFNGDGVADVAVVDKREVFILYGQPPALPANATRESARDLGLVVHVVQPTSTITPTKQDSWYRFEVPSEAIASGDQVIDFSGGFSQQERGGLAMEVVDAAGNVRGAGERFRVVATQGETLFVHVFGQSDGLGQSGIGAYTLVIDTLPQVAAVEAQSFLPGSGDAPGGPTTSLVLVLQGDRLDPQFAEDPSNYRVTWLGPDGQRGTDDDQVIPVGFGLSESALAVIYDPGSNVDVSSGRTYPTAIRQTVTLLFGQPLPAGSYAIEAAPITTSDFAVDESALLSPSQDGTGHSLVTILDGQIQPGLDLTLPNLVRESGLLGDLSVFEVGTRFLTQFHNDTGALLDALLSQYGDDPEITQFILNQVVARFDAALGPLGEQAVSLLILFLDPVSIGLVDPAGHTFTYNLQTNSVANALPQTFVEVGGNVEVVVIPNPIGAYELNLANVTSRSRGGAVYLSGQGAEIHSFTEAMRAQSLDFLLNTGGLSLAATIVPSIFSIGPAAPTSAGEPVPTAGSPNVTGTGNGSGVPGILDAIATGLSAALRSVSPQALGATLTAQGSAAPETGSAAAAQGESLVAASPGGSSSGAATAAGDDPLGALEEVLSRIWEELTRGILEGLRGAEGNAESEGSENGPLSPLMRTLRNLLGGMFQPQGTNASNAPRRNAADAQDAPQADSSPAPAKAAQGTTRAGTAAAEYHGRRTRTTWPIKAHAQTAASGQARPAIVDLLNKSRRAPDRAPDGRSETSSAGNSSDAASVSE